MFTLSEMPSQSDKASTNLFENVNMNVNVNENLFENLFGNVNTTTLKNNNNVNVDSVNVNSGSENFVSGNLMCDNGNIPEILMPQNATPFNTQDTIDRILQQLQAPTHTSQTSQTSSSQTPSQSNQDNVEAPLRSLKFGLFSRRFAAVKNNDDDDHVEQPLVNDRLATQQDSQDDVIGLTPVSTEMMREMERSKRKEANDRTAAFAAATMQRTRSYGRQLKHSLPTEPTPLLIQPWFSLVVR